MKFLLPNYYNNFQNNMQLHEDFSNLIVGVEGHYPFSIAYGSYNNIAADELALFPDMVGAFKDYELWARFVLFDFGNIHITPNDYTNNYNRVILEEFANNKTCYFMVAIPFYIDYLVTTYPEIQILLHQNYVINHNTDEITELFNKYPNNLKGLIITKDYDYDKSLLSRDILKFYLLSITNCQQCNRWRRCMDLEMKATYDFSSTSIINKCKYLTYKSLPELQEEYKHINADYVLFDTLLLDRGLTEIDQRADFLASLGALNENI